jgi:predicted alpha/beta hydrolase family esterase
MDARSAAGTVVLVHGGFVDGSGWQGVYEHLKKDGHSVSVVQNPMLSHADDVAVTKRAIDAAGEPVILVGHSYGGAVITEAGNHPKVAALVYIAAFPLVATEDRMIPHSAQRAMPERAGSTVTDVAGSHAIYVSQPAAVAELIETAVTATANVPVST